jgi:hypothetical protein
MPTLGMEPTPRIDMQPCWKEVARSMQPVDMDVIVDGQLYTTRRALLLADDAGPDGSMWERSGRNTFLFRDPSGIYFAEHRSAWGVDSDYVEVLSASRALQLYDELPIHEVEPTRIFSDD